MCDVLFFFSLLLSLSLSLTQDDVHSLTLEMDTDNVKPDEYYCTSVDLPTEENYIIGFDPHINSSIVHHMILFGCTGRQDDKTIHNDNWNCITVYKVCDDSKFTTLFAWALQAEGLALPKDVGIKVGEGSAVQYIVMQIHFQSTPTREEDYPALDILITNTTQPFIAGIYLFGGYLGEGLEPRQEAVSIDVACKFDGPNTIHPFAFRTHTHSFGSAMYGYVIKADTGEWQLIGQRNPQDPQAFYPTEEGLDIVPGDMLAVRAYYNTLSQPDRVMFGAHGFDEMCNYYLMYYTENSENQLYNNECWSTAPDNLEYPDSSHVLPTHVPQVSHDSNDNDDPNQESINEDHTHPESHDQGPTEDTSFLSDILEILTTDNEFIPVLNLDESWPLNTVTGVVGEIQLGQVSAVDVDSINNVHILHRGNRQWTSHSFNMNNQFMEKHKGTISEPVVLKLSPSGTLLDTWGRDFFYLPHGLKLDSTNQYWITDVARHQVLKALPKLKNSPLGLGTAFEPGNDNYHFCQPADVEVDEKNSNFFVADGYCNHRVIVYSLNGVFRYEFPSFVGGKELYVPHSLALSQDGHELFVADRENSRIILYDTISREGRVFVDSDVLGGAIYAISFGNLRGDWPLYAINGSMTGEDKAVGFTLDRDGSVINTWSPPEGFVKPHDLAVSSDGLSVYVAEIGPNNLWKFSVTITSHDTPITNTTTDATTTLSHDESTTMSHVEPTTMSHDEPTTMSHHDDTAVTISHDTNLTLSTPPGPSSSPSTSDEDITITPPTNSDDDYICPRPPAPPTSNCTLITSNVSGCVSTCQPTPTDQPPSSSTISSSSYNSVLFMFIILLSMISLCVVLVLVIVVCLCSRHSKLHPKKRYLVRRHYTVDPKKKLQSLLNPARKGFTPISTVDSDSDIEFTVFQKT